MPKVDLAKVQREAKKIRARHPNKSNAMVMKEAWREARGGKVSGTAKRKKRSVKRKAVGKKPRYYAREVHEVRRIGAISYTGGKVKISGTGQVEETKKKLRHEIGEQLGWLEVLKSQQTTKRAKGAVQKEIAKKKSELNRIK